MVLSSSTLTFAARVDTRQNTADRVDDKQDTHEERRDCTGEGADCRSDNRQDKGSDTVDRTEDRVNELLKEKGSDYRISGIDVENSIPPKVSFSVTQGSQ